MNRNERARGYTCRDRQSDTVLFVAGNRLSELLLDRQRGHLRCDHRHGEAPTWMNGPSSISSPNMNRPPRGRVDQHVAHPGREVLIRVIATESSCSVPTRLSGTATQSLLQAWPDPSGFPSLHRGQPTTALGYRNPDVKEAPRRPDDEQDRAPPRDVPGDGCGFVGVDSGSFIRGSLPRRYQLLHPALWRRGLGGAGIGMSVR